MRWRWRSRFRLWVLAAAAVGPSGGGASQTWQHSSALDFAASELDMTAVTTAGAVALAAVAADRNLAQGQPVKDRFGNSVPLTDGDISQHSEWVSGTPDVFGQAFTVDLGVERAVTRVRVRAGETAWRLRPEYFLRGYRIEVARGDGPRRWQAVAEQERNFALHVDTAVDSTWIRTDAGGAPVPAVGRFVRVVITRQDESNWVVLGEVEVYGSGFASAGAVIGRFVSAAPVNVGAIDWVGSAPPRTSVRLQVRGSADGLAWPPWDEVPEVVADNAQFAGVEPVRAVEYRARLTSADPAATPRLEGVRVAYDPRPLATRIGAWVTPGRATRGERAGLIYLADVEVGPGDRGIDRLRIDGQALQITEVRFGGAVVPPGDGVVAGWRASAAVAGTGIELGDAHRIGAAGRLEIEFEGLFLLDRTPLPLRAGSREQVAEEGRANWQNAEPAGAGWTVTAAGEPGPLLTRLQVAPERISPHRGEAVAVTFVVGLVVSDADVALAVHSVDGRRLRRIVQTGGARAYRFEWDGRDDGGRVVPPGLYLLEVEVGAQDVSARRWGRVVVAY